MKLQFLLLSLCILGFSTHGNSQNNSINHYNLKTKSSIILPEIEYDDQITDDKTASNIGLFNDQIEHLPNEIPTENIWPGSNFQMKEIATNDFILQNYPVRTSVKMFALVDGEFVNGCSGSMVSKNHVLSSAHCLDKETGNEILADTIMVCPIYDQGVVDPFFGCTYVTDAYFPEDWKETKLDLVLFKTEENIGNETGWIGFGYNENDVFFEDKIGHKFSYPARTIQAIDPRTYNGDTLYHSYGLVDVIEENSLGFLKAHAIPGESGSSLIIQEEGLQFTTYGQLRWSGHMIHMKIQKHIFYAFKDILESEITAIKPEKDILVSVYPNPTVNQVFVETENSINRMNLFNEAGSLIKQTSGNSFDLTSYPSGVYFVQVQTDKGQIVKKVVKQSL